MKKCFCYILLIVLSISTNSCNDRVKSVKNDNDSVVAKPITQTIKEARDTILTYGLPDFERHNSREVIAEKWKINFKAVAGCLVSQELIDSVKKHNEIVDRKLEIKYGKNWEVKFYQEVDIEFKKEQIITKLLDRIDYIKKKDGELDKEGNGLHYLMTPIDNSDNYNVSVQGWGKWEGKYEWLKYFKLIVNYKSKKIKLISNKIEKE